MAENSFRLKPVGAILIATFLVVFQNSRPVEPRRFDFTGKAQGTTFHITYFAADSVIGRNQFDSIFIVLDNSLSIYKSNSLINRFNHSTTGIKTDEHLGKVVAKALRVFEDSGGVFDVTVLPLVRAWGFGPERVSSWPDSAKVKSILKCVGSGKLSLKNDFLSKSLPCVEIDLNGIAQGYSVDVIAGFLDQHHINNYLVEIGGELRVKGHRQPGNEVMSVGIEGPAGAERVLEIRKTIYLTDGAVTTSGSYQKHLRMDNKTISHLMNPKTGFPIRNEMISATVVARDAITADGYDNVLMNLGVKESLRFMEQHADMEAYLIYTKDDGSIAEAFTSGFAKYCLAGSR